MNAQAGLAGQGMHLFIVNDFPPILGGQSAFLYYLCRSLPVERVLVLAPECGDTSEIDRRLRFTVVRRHYLIKVPWLEKLVKIILPIFWAGAIIRQRQVACLHCAHVLSTGFVGLFYKQFHQLDYVVYSHSADILEHQGNPLLRPWLVKILKEACYVVASSRFTAEKLKALGVPSSRILISWPKIDSQEFAKGQDMRPVLERYGLIERRIILSVGRLVERKGHDKVIEALPEIIRECPDAVYVIFGRGPYSARLRSLVAEKGLGDAVRFLEGGDAEKIALMQACEVFVMVSREIKARGDTEGFGIVYLEAGACGKPVVAGDSGGVRDAVIDQQTGLLVDPEDPAAVAGAVKRLLADPALARRLGQQGRTRTMTQFDYRCGAAELEPILKEH